MADGVRSPELPAGMDSTALEALKEMLFQEIEEAQLEENGVSRDNVAMDAMEGVTPSDVPCAAAQPGALQVVIQDDRIALPEETVGVPRDAICEAQDAISELPESIDARQHSIRESSESLFVDDADVMEIELPPPPTRTKRKRAPVAPMAPSQGDETPSDLITALHAMINNADPGDFLAAQVDITALVLRLKHLHDQQPPKVSFTPAVAASRRTRLEAALELLIADICAIPPLSWVGYRKKLLRFSEGEAVCGMSFAERLYKVAEIVYMPEELDALPKEDFERLRGVVRICVTAAQALTVEGEESTDGLGERWVQAKTRDLEFFRKMFCSMRRTFKASVGEGEGEEVEMPWEKKREQEGSGQ